MQIIEKISIATGLSRRYLKQLANNSDLKYIRYSIAKKSSKQNDRRVIFHPFRKLKLIQSWLAKNIFKPLPIHNNVYSYREDVSIKNLADKHVGNDYLLRIDFKDFFPSLSDGDIKSLLAFHYKDFNQESLEFIASICCKGGGLPIGAPSSPVISNALLYDLDLLWSYKAEELGATYSRYADDIYFSSNQKGILSGLFEEFKEYIQTMQTPSLQINHEKTIFTSRKRRRMVTGLILTTDRKISIGRDRKRKIKALMHHFSQGTLPPKEIQYLKGMISFVKSVEPSFIEGLNPKYRAVLLKLRNIGVENTHRIHQPS